jgi:hypothetical protein
MNQDWCVFGNFDASNIRTLLVEFISQQTENYTDVKKMIYQNGTKNLSQVLEKVIATSLACCRQKQSHTSKSCDCFISVTQTIKPNDFVSA